MPDKIAALLVWVHDFCMCALSHASLTNTPTKWTTHKCIGKNEKESEKWQREFGDNSRAFYPN